MIKKPTLSGVSLLLVVVLSLVIAPIATAQSSGIGGKPARPDPANERSKSIFIHTLEPGASKEDAVEVINNSDSTKKIQVYAVDSVSSSGGAFACAQASQKAVEAGSWVKLSETNIELAAGKTKQVPFTIKVPQGAEAGEHNACIIIQAKSEKTFQGGIGINFRTGIRLAILVPGDIKKELSATALDVKQQDNGVIVTPKVYNSGSVSLDTDVTVQVKSFLGTVIQEQAGQFPVLRNQDTEWNFEFARPFWGGFYQATFSATYDSSKSGYIGMPESGSKQQLNGPSKWFFSTPHPAALVIEIGFLVLVLLAVKFHLGRKLFHKKVQAQWSNYSVKKAEHLRDIANKHNVSWKQLAKANKLKAPYHIAEGQKIKVPNKK